MKSNTIITSVKFNKIKFIIDQSLNNLENSIESINESKKNNHVKNNKRGRKKKFTIKIPNDHSELNDNSKKLNIIK